MNQEDRLNLVISIANKNHKDLIENGKPFVKTNDVLELLELIILSASASEEFIDANAIRIIKTLTPMLTPTKKDSERSYNVC